jgi:PAS domain S-box-containing protein
MNQHPQPISTLDARHFELLVSSVSDYAIYMLSPDGLVNSWNAGAQRFKGYLPHEIIGRHFSVFYTDEERAAGIPAYALDTALRTGKFEAEGWRVRKDGTRFWASVVIDPVRDEGGALIGYAKITRDMTEKKRTQEALRASEERFRLLVQGVTDYAIYMLTPEGAVSNWNAGAQRIKGYAEAEVVGTHFSRFYTDEDRAAGLPVQALAVATRDGRFEKEGWRVRKDGSRFWAHVVIDAIRGDTGELLGFAKVTRDVTERKEAAEALERANAALVHAQKMEAIGQLTGGVAHDFNNLLGVVASSLDILGSRLHDPLDVRLLAGMQRAVERGSTLTSQLLAFARKQPLKVERHNPTTLIEAFETVLRRAGNSTIGFEFDLQPDLHDVNLDAASFEAALLNLVVNARDAMPDGGRIVVGTANVALRAGQIGALPAGPYVAVTVRDTGSGMPADVMARAFEPFFTTKEVGKGTGLGLSQVYGFFTQSGGDVTLGHGAGGGTVVTVYLPALAPDGSALDAAEGSDAETVLIVEDEPDLLEVASALFRSMGYEVVAANNAREAIDQLERRKPVDILFSDVMMPQMSGVELGLYVAEHYPDIKILLASGYAMPALQQQYGELRRFPLIGKPYRLSDLARKLRTLQ